MEKKKVIIIVGPTSSGKTSLSIDVAKKTGGEVISADSRQVYTGMDLGTGKVTKEEMDGIPHHLLDVADPSEVFTASDFVEKGRSVLQDIWSRNKIPIIAGGTGFYIDALLGHISLADIPPNPNLRAGLESLTLEELNQELANLDPERHKTIDTKNPRRLIRAIEVAHAKPEKSSNEMEPIASQELWLGLTVPTEELRKKIHDRLIARLDAGMLDEAKQLHNQGVSFERMETLGLEYRYMARHLEGNLEYEEMVNELEQEIANYAKRQMTWFKRKKNIAWFQPSEINEAIKQAEHFSKT